MPLARPLTTQDVVAVVHVNEPGVEVTVYNVIASPLSTAAAHETVADKSPRVAVTKVGADGLVAGMAALDAPPVPAPITLRATTENVYDVPLVKPVKVHVVGSKPLISARTVHVASDGVAVTM